MGICKFWKICLNECTDDCKDFAEEDYIAEADDIWHERNKKNNRRIVDNPVKA